MIYLVLAEPRTGKTQLAVQKLCAEKEAGKRVFVTNFKQTPEQRVASGFEVYGDAPDWDWAKESEWRGDVSKWFEELPHGSVWLIDEAQEVIPQRDKSTKVADWVKLFSKHGHHDLTIYLVTQDAMQLDVTMRRNTNFTLHLSRPLGLRYANVYTFKRFQEMPNDAWRRSQTLKSAESKVRFKYNKKFEALYVSASAHEHIKRRLPKRLLVLPIAVLIVGSLLWFAYSRLKGQASAEDAGAVASVSSALLGDAASKVVEASRSEPVLTPDQFNEKFKERLPGVPWSAPAYDRFEVTDYPRPQCWVGRRGCRCVTQQGSGLDIGPEQCMDYVHNGYWDPYRKVPPEASKPAAGPLPAQTALPVTVWEGASPNVTGSPGEAVEASPPGDRS